LSTRAFGISWRKSIIRSLMDEGGCSDNWLHLAHLHDGQFAHWRHAGIARRAILSQQIVLLIFRNKLDADPKSDA
jgi:hypothetical protein